MKKLKPLFDILASCAMAGLVGWGFWWLTAGVAHHSRLWWTVAAVLLGVPLALWCGFIAWMASRQWLDKRRCARESREWRP